MKERDSYLDNAKFILMVLVVFTHFFMGMTEKRGVYEDLYYLLFTIHMPTFILISGYFSKNVVNQGKWLRKSYHFLWLYVLFQVSYSFFYYATGLEASFDLTFLIPEWSLWFLLSMVFWYVWLYSLRKIPAAISIPISIVVAIMIGYFPEVGRELALQRACVFFPYFLIGYHLPKHFFDIFKSRTMRYLGLAALFILFIYVVKIDGANKYWFFGSKPYHDFMDFPEFGALIRGLFYLLSVIGVCGFLGVVPTNKYWFTKYGANTLNVYLFHGFIVKLLRRYFPFEAISFIPAIITFSFFALGLTVLLASERFKKWTSSLLNLF